MRQTEHQVNTSFQPNQFVFARSKPIHYQYVIVDGMLNLPELQDELFELNIDIHKMNASFFHIILNDVNNYKHTLMITYDVNSNMIKLKNREHTKQLTLNKPLHHLHIFKNIQSIVIYLNEGDQTLESHFDFKSGMTQVQFESIDGEVFINEVNKWILHV